MTGMTLTLRTNPNVHLDASLLGGQFASEPITEILQLRLPVIAGKHAMLVQDLFNVQPRTDDRVVIRGDLAHLHHIGNRWSTGKLFVEGNVGDGFASRLSGGEVHLHGNAGNKTAEQMRGGILHVIGNVGDDLGCPLHGRRSGMSGGTIHIVGNAGQYAGYRMRRGTMMIQGDCGPYLGCDIVAGTIITTGRIDRGLAVGMHRGTVIVPSGTSFSPLRFTPPESQRLSIASIIANDVEARLPNVAAALRSSISRSLGDMTCGGRGEIWIY
ncbi:MAG TPA: formylmethanofuran dehydrogenase subunit C [Planctomycetaceae bacterium]|nr:formylmethanofuran dehydrogenase subunit C [Planctomycetaceae bacterium]